MSQWVCSQQKWATSMVASRSADYQRPMPMDIDRVQDANEKGKKGKRKGKTGKGDHKGKEGDQKGKVKDKTR